MKCMNAVQKNSQVLSVLNYAITRSTRDLPPAHFSLKIESYSLLSQAVLEKFESCVFEACQHKWRLYLYPRGKAKIIGTGHISLYLAIAETEKLPLGWEVNASFKFFLYDQIRDMYLTIQDSYGTIRRFNDIKTEWGFAKVLPSDTFNDPSQGYLVNDCCVFGVEVSVYERSNKRQFVSMIREPPDRTMTWKIEKFSTLDKSYYYSQEFTVGGLKWKLLVYPKGGTNQIPEAISIYVNSCDSILSEHSIYAEYKLRIRNQVQNNHKEIQDKQWFSKSDNAWGLRQFMFLNDLNDAFKGFLVNDTIIVEAEIIVMSTVK
uniref:MATH domain-containing protein n=1 Tax=Quercus lobata TaxID=97700 RepID=A0A7N2LE54_QUELO